MKRKVPVTQEDFSAMRQGAIDKMRTFVDLPPDWDSYGAVTPTQVAVEAAINLWNLFPDGVISNIYVVPHPHGGVSFEYRGPFNGKRVGMIIDITSEGKIDGILLGETEVEFIKRS